MVAQQIENMVCCVYVDIQWAECGLKFGLKDYLRKHLRGVYAIIYSCLCTVDSSESPPYSEHNYCDTLLLWVDQFPGIHYNESRLNNVIMSCIEHFSSAGVWPVQCKWGSCNHSVTHDSEVIPQYL